MAQVFSAWTRPTDAPLRIVLDQGKLYARIEAGGSYSTPGVEVQLARWYSIAAVKKGANLTLYLDGKPVGSCNAPIVSNTQSTACALGGNPRFACNEYLAARFSDFTLYVRALSEQEVSAAAAPK